MSHFQELKYFKHIVIEELNIYSSINDEKIKEIYLRNIVSRLYYTVMHLCIEKFNIEIDPTEKTHPQVQKSLPKGLKIRLKSLQKLREKADYNSQENFHFPLSTKKGTKGIFLNSIEHIKETLEFFENLQKDDGNN